MKNPFASDVELDPSPRIGFAEAYHKACADVGIDPFAKGQLHGDLYVLRNAVEVVYHGNSIPRDIMAGTLDHYNQSNEAELGIIRGVVGNYGIEHTPGIEHRKEVMMNLSQIAYWGVIVRHDTIG